MLGMGFHSCYIPSKAGVTEGWPFCPDDSGEGIFQRCEHLPVSFLPDCTGEAILVGVHPRGGNAGYYQYPQDTLREVYKMSDLRMVRDMLHFKSVLKVWIFTFFPSPNVFVESLT
jgi:hypothetical protein